MRAVSGNANYTLQLVEAIPKRGLDSQGTVVEFSDTKPVIAEFRTGTLTQWEELEGLQHFSGTLGALPEGVNPLTRLSSFDTEAYVQRYPDPQEREAMLKLLDSRLTELSKIFRSDFIIVEKPAAPIPWPSYDKDTVDAILKIQADQEYSPQVIRLYEIENKNRDSVISAMQNLEDEAVAEGTAIQVAL